MPLHRKMLVVIEMFKFLDLTCADVELMTVAGVELTGVELTGADVELMNGAGGNLVGGVESWS